MHDIRRIGIFIKGLFGAWWQMMSCAAFVLLTIFAAEVGCSNAWAIRGSEVLAFIFFFIACYKAWNRQYNAWEDLNTKNLRCARRNGSWGSGAREAT